MQERTKLFALDTGTRSVVGIILEKHDQKYHVIDMLSIEHSERAMLDGQIHDVLSVSKIITEIKEKLEKKHGPLKKVCVAAAGRALKTAKATVTVSIKGKPMMTKEDIIHLELCAVQAAQAEVAKKHENEENSHYYYCVGYSVLYYRLDGEEIGSLIDQQGEEASVEIIATFLPKVVVESLIAALHRSNLEVDALTLEPIAAINVLIPPTMRRLNVALVDIGAGTSDIAITDSGTIIAYGMVPIAGDEITEAISDQYLLDFPLAETAKRELLTNEFVTITDILGFETKVSREEVISQISDTIDRLASSISDEIVRLNGNKPPKAVMLVGGGSLTPELPKRIADKLGLPENRVAIRGIDAISNLTIENNITKGPELVTPIGIAIAAQKNPVKYFTVYVNEQPIRLFEVNHLTVGDALLSAGIKMNKLFGKPGMAMIISLNGKTVTIPGKLGQPPILLKNGEECSLDDEVYHNDHLFVKNGKDGEKTVLQIKELLDDIPVRHIKINNKGYTIKPKIICNGQPAPPERYIEDRDIIECTIPETIEEALIELNLQNLLDELKPFKLTINEKDTFFPSYSGKILKNGIEAKPYHSFENGDEITVGKRENPTIKGIAAIKQIVLSQSIPVLFNGKEVWITKRIADFRRNGELLTEEDQVENGDHLTVTRKKMEPFIFQDVFNVIDIEIPTNATGNFVLLQNNEPTTFDAQIKPGDDLQIIWSSPKTT